LSQALSAVEEIGPDHCNGVETGYIAVYIFKVSGRPISPLVVALFPPDRLRPRLFKVLDGEALPQIEEKLRAVPSLLRNLIDANITFMVGAGCTTGAFGTIVAANLFGKDEDNAFDFAQKDIDGVVALDVELMACKTFGGIFLLAPNQCRAMLSLCTADSNKVRVCSVLLPLLPSFPVILSPCPVMPPPSFRTYWLATFGALLASS